MAMNVRHLLKVPSISATRSLKNIYPFTSANYNSIHTFVKPDREAELVDKLDHLLKNPSLISQVSNKSEGTKPSNHLQNYLYPNLVTQLSLIETPVSATVAERVIQRCNGEKNYAIIPRWKPALGFFLWSLQTQQYPAKPTKTLNELLSLLCKYCKFDIAWQVFDEMKNRGFTIEFDSFRILINGYVMDSLPDEGARAFERMEEFGYSPTVADYVELMGILCNNNFVIDAQKFFNRFKDKVVLDVSIYNNLMRGWINAHDLLSAYEVLAEIKAQGLRPNSESYTCLIEGLCGEGKLKDAWNVFCEMLGANCIPSVDTVNAFVRVLVKNEEVREAFKVVSQFKQRGLMPDVTTYELLIQGCCKLGKWQDAMKQLDEMIGRGLTPNPSAFNHIFEVTAHLNDVKGAYRLFNRMESSGCDPDTQTYNVLMRLFAQNKSTDMVMRLRQEMDAKGCEPDVNTYTILIKMFCDFGHWNMAYKIIREMTEEKGIPPTEELYRMVLETLQSASEFTKVEELVQKMDSLGFSQFL